MKNIVLAANGLGNNGKIIGTPDLVSYLKERKVRTVINIGFAEWKLQPSDAHLNHESFAVLAEMGIEVFDLPANQRLSDDSLQELVKKNAIYIPGGAPGVLRWQLEVTSADQLIIAFHRAGKPVIGCSAGAIILGSGRLLPTCLFAPAKPPSSSGISRKIVYGLGMQGLGIIPYTVIPHHAEDGPIARYLSGPIRSLTGEKDIVFVPDAEIRCF